MKISTYVEFCQEVDVEVSAEDIIAAFSEYPEPGETWFVVLNRFATCLNAIPEDTIASWTPAQRKTICAFLEKVTARFAESREEPTP